MSGLPLHIGAASFSNAGSMPMACDGAVHIKAEPRKSSSTKRKVRSPVRAPRTASPLRPATPADHGTRKAPAAEVPRRSPAQQPAEAAAAAPIEPKAQPALASAADVAAKLPAEPQAQQDASLAAQQALSIVAALDELHAYIMSCGGALGEGWTVLFHEKGSGSTPTYLPPEGFQGADGEESRGPFLSKHLVARALGLAPHGSRSLRRRNAGADTDADAGPGTEDDDEQDEYEDEDDQDMEDGHGSPKEFAGENRHASKDAEDTLAAGEAATADELRKLEDFVKSCGGTLPPGWSARRIRCFAKLYRALYDAPKGFQAVEGQPTKVTYTSKGNVAAALGLTVSRKARQKTRTGRAGPSGAAGPRSKKPRTLDTLSPNTENGNTIDAVINVPSSRTSPAIKPPCKDEAVGWRVRVREQHDQRRMVNAVVRNYDPPTGQYQLRFDSGDEAWRHLTDNVRWISASPREQSPASFSSDDYSSDSREEDESDGSEPIPAPPSRRRKHSRRPEASAEPEALFDIEIEQPETSQEPNAALVGPVASRAGPFAAAAQQAAPGGRPGYQGAWNRFKTGIPKKDTEHLYECMAEIGITMVPGWTCSYTTTVRKGKPDRDICYIPPPGFKAVNGQEGRMYWSRPDVARAHGATSWPSRCPPRGVPSTNQPSSKPSKAQSGAASTPTEEDDDAIGEQKEWLQDFLGAEFEKAGWDNGAIAWQDVAKRKADLSNDAIFQKVKALNRRAEEKFPLLKNVSGKDGTAVIKKKIMMLFVNATKRAKKRMQGGEEAPRPAAMQSSKRYTPADKGGLAIRGRQASEAAHEQPHVQFPDDSPYSKQGAGDSQHQRRSPLRKAGTRRPYQPGVYGADAHAVVPSSNPASPDAVPLNNALMRVPDMRMEQPDRQAGSSGQGVTGEQAKRRTVAEHFFFFLRQPGATPEFLQELHRLAQNAM